MRYTHLAVLSILLFCINSATYAQDNRNNTPPLEINFQQLSSPNEFRFSIKNIPSLPKLVGKSVPKWSYFWELGDGSFLKTEAPTVTHIYPLGKDTYQVRVQLSPHYVPPDILPQTAHTSLEINGRRGKNYTKSFPKNLLRSTFIDLFANQEPVPGHAVRFSMVYKYPENFNNNKSPVNGLLLLYYNHKDLPGESYSLPSQQISIHDKNIKKGFPSDIKERDPFYKDFIKNRYAKYYRNVKVWRLNDLKPGEIKSLFFTLNTLKNSSQRARDVNKSAPIAAVIWPNGLSDHNSSTYSSYVKELNLTIKSSLDPNKINVNVPQIFTYPVDKTLLYTIRFENKGNEPARRVRIAVENPLYFNPESFKTLDYSPKCPPCAKVNSLEPCIEIIQNPDSLIWIFKNVEIRGKKEQNLTKSDEIGGWIDFQLTTHPAILHLLDNGDLKKISLQAVITFDTWKSIKTNKAKTYLTDKKFYVSIGTRPGFWLESIFDSDINAEDALSNLFVNLDRTFYEGRYFYTKINGGYSNQYFETNLDNPELKQFELSNLELGLSAHHALFRGLNFGLGPTAAVILNAKTFNVQDRELSQTYNLFKEAKRDSSFHPMAFGGFAEANLNLKYFIWFPLHLKLRFDSRKYLKIKGEEDVWRSYFTLGLNIGISNGTPEYIRLQEKLQKKRRGR